MRDAVAGHEGGELGYALAHAAGAAFDHPNLVVACVIGDGEAETGPLSGSWKLPAFLNPRRDGAVLPILQNTIVGLRQVDQRTIEASRGIGYSAFRTLVQVELPLAVPVILNGVRTALVILVGTATLSTFIGATSLGTLITTGVTLFLPKLLISGAILVALLAMIIDWLGRLFELIATPKGVA